MPNGVMIGPRRLLKGLLQKPGLDLKKTILTALQKKHVKGNRGQQSHEPGIQRKKYSF